jgi:uncharacterized membrane protein
MAIGAVMGGIMGHFTDVGISDDFIKQVRAKVTEGTSALFLMTENATVDKVAQAFAGVKMELLQTNLSAEQEAQLRAAFGEEAAEAASESDGKSGA